MLATPYIGRAGPTGPGILTGLSGPAPGVGATGDDGRQHVRPAAAASVPIPAGAPTMNPPGGRIMPGEVVTVAGGLVAAAAGLWGHAVGWLVAQADGGGGPPSGVTTGIGVAGLIMALIPLVDRILKHRETMQDSELRDRVEDLEARDRLNVAAIARGDRERDALKQLLAKMFPVVVEQHEAIEQDRAALRWAKAKLGDELPLPERFGARDFDQSIHALLAAGQLALLANTPPSPEIVEIVEGRRAMPTPDPDAPPPPHPSLPGDAHAD